MLGRKKEQENIYATSHKVENETFELYPSQYFASDSYQFGGFINEKQIIINGEHPVNYFIEVGKTIKLYDINDEENPFQFTIKEINHLENKLVLKDVTDYGEE